MANTYTLISSNVLTSSAASVTFSSIPSTYTDLVLRISARSDVGNRIINIQFNSATTNYSSTYLLGNGSTASSSRDTAQTAIVGYNSIDLSTATANTFSNVEIYIPSYTAAQSKPLNHFGVTEDNNATSYMIADAGLWQNTAAITSIVLTANSGNLVTGSSFYLYGIKNS